MEVAVVLKSDPFSWKAIQAYKIACALSLKCSVYFIALKEGVYFLSDWNPQELEYENFKLYRCNFNNLKVVIEEDDFRIRGLSKNSLWLGEKPILLLPEEEIALLLRRCSVVGVW